ncbi:MAG: DEAD/DEAH box helicase family protein [Bacteroidota bacterium]
MKFSNIFQKKYFSWKELEKVIESLPTTKQRGDAFEEFVFAYLNIKKQLYQVKEVYMSTDIPTKYLTKYKIEKKDSGIDGLIIRDDDSAAAYQVKFRTGRAKPSYGDLSKFWVEAKNTDYNYTIANCYSITDLSLKIAKHLQILVDEFDLLDANFFEEFFAFANNKTLKEKKKHTPHDFQKEIIKDVVSGFKKDDRGKLIAACGTGKTLTALWITEMMNNNTVLFLAPSLALIKQTLEAWADQAKFPFSYLCVCSDKTVSSDLDDGDISTSELNIPVTTTPSEIVDFIKTKTNSKKYVFSTYQSLEVVAEAMSYTNNFTFDLIIFDEAHRTAGAKETQLFGFALTNQSISSKKRLFMTATERLIKPRLKKAAKEAGKVIFSMDDEIVYGKTFHKYNFGDAISDEVISDYEIVVAGIQQSDYYKWIKENKDLEALVNSNAEYSTAQILFSQLILAKAIKEYPIQKIISFHSSVKNAKLFAGEIANTIPLRNVIKQFNKNITDENLFISHVNGSMPTGDRKEILDIFKDTEFALVSNARCLTEGVDVPIIDSVYFVDNKSSLIDIVQACGRALRKPDATKHKTAFFLIPILIPDNIKGSEVVNLDAFETVFNVIQSLRDQDNRLAEWINELNRNAVKGKFPKYGKGKWKPVTLSLPQSIDLTSFEEHLYLKIADVNKNPSSENFKVAKVYGKKERKSSQKRIFKTLGDYSVESYYSNLVKPTIKAYKGKTNTLDISKIKVNNNNVSHTKRLGLIINDKKNYSITPLGEKYKKGEIKDTDLFKRQMLRYFSSLEDGNAERILFPYRACIKVLLEVGSISIHEFAFAIYSMDDSTPESIERAIADIKYLRENYKNLYLISEANRKSILKELNDYFGTNYNATEIWTQRTTIYNQFVYFRNHLALFTEFIKIDSEGKIVLVEKNAAKARHLLSLDNRLEFENNHQTLLSKYIQPFLSFVIFTI